MSVAILLGVGITALLVVTGSYPLLARAASGPASGASPSMIIGGGGGGGGCDLTYNLTLTIAGGKGTMDLEGYNGTGGPGLWGPYSSGQKLELCIGATYIVVPLPNCDYVFKSWTGTKVTVTLTDGMWELHNVTKIANGAAAALKLTLESSTAYVQLPIFVTGGEGVVGIWDLVNDTGLAYTNDTVACLPEDSWLQISAEPSAGWTFAQWYAPGASLGSGFSALSSDTELNFTAGGPRSLTLVETPPANLATNSSAWADPWSGVLAPYAHLQDVAGTFTIPSVTYNATPVNYGIGTVGAEMLSESVSIGAYAGLGSYLFQAGFTEYINPANPGTVVTFAFAFESANTSYGQYTLLDFCWLPSSLYNDGSPTAVPPGCIDNGNDFAELPSVPSVGTTVTANVTYLPSDSNCADNGYALQASFSWGSTGTGKFWCYMGPGQGGYNELVNPAEPSQAAWTVFVPSYLWYTSDYVTQVVAGPTVLTPSTLGGEEVQEGSPETWVPYASLSPISVEVGGWMYWNDSTPPYGENYFVSYFPSTVAQSGAFSVPARTVLTCITCLNYQLYEAISAPFVPTSAPPSSGTFGCENLGGCSVSVTGGLSSYTSGAVGGAIAAGQAGADGFWVTDLAGVSVSWFTPTISGDYEFVFDWTLQWQVSITENCPVDWEAPGVGVAAGNVTLGVETGGWNYTQISHPVAFGPNTQTVVNKGSYYDVCVSGGDWSGTSTATSELQTFLWAGDSYVFYSELTGVGTAWAALLGDGNLTFALQSPSGVDSQLNSAAIYVGALAELPGT